MIGKAVQRQSHFRSDHRSREVVCSAIDTGSDLPLLDELVKNACMAGLRLIYIIHKTSEDMVSSACVKGKKGSCIPPLIETGVISR